MAALKLGWIRDSVLALLLVVLSIGDVVRFFFSKAQDDHPHGSPLPNDLVLRWTSVKASAKALSSYSKAKEEAHPTSSDEAGDTPSQSPPSPEDVEASVHTLRLAVHNRLSSPQYQLLVQTIEQRGTIPSTTKSTDGAIGPAASGGRRAARADDAGLAEGRTNADDADVDGEVLVGVTATLRRLGEIAEGMQMVRRMKKSEGGGARRYKWQHRHLFEHSGLKPATHQDKGSGGSTAMAAASGAGEVAPAAAAPSSPEPAMFTSGERVRLVWSVLHGATVGRAVGQLLGVAPNAPLLSTLKRRGLLTSWFAVHNGSEKRALEETWIRSLFKAQPIDGIKDYLGEKVAMYFSFIGSYTSALVLPAIAGVIAHLLQTKHGMEGRATLLYSVFIMTWATVFLEKWKRTQSRNAFRWNTLDFQLEEDKEVDEFVRHPGTGEWVPRVSNDAWWYRRLVSPGVVLVMIGISCMAMYGTEVFTEYVRLVFEEKSEGETIREWVESMPDYVGMAVPHSPLLVYAASIPALDAIFTTVATRLTELEQRETRTRKHNSLIVKLVLFQFWNNFMSLFYLAFVLQDLDRLRARLGVLLVVRQLIDNFLEVGLPVLKSRLRVSHTDRKGKADTKDTGKQALNQECVEAELEPYEDTFDDMLELFVQYGHVTLFAAAFPLAAVCAMVNNIIEIRSDAYKVLSVQRPVAHRCANIGSWLTAFEVLGYVAVVTNCGLVALATDNLASYVPSWSLVSRVILLVVIEHSLVAAKLLLDVLIPDTPSDVRLALQLLSAGNRVESAKLAAQAQIITAQDVPAREAVGSSRADQSVLDAPAKALDTVVQAAHALSTGAGAGAGAGRGKGCPHCQGGPLIRNPPMLHAQHIDSRANDGEEQAAADLLGLVSKRVVMGVSSSSIARGLAFLLAAVMFLAVACAAIVVVVFIMRPALAIDMCAPDIVTTMMPDPACAGQGDSPCPMIETTTTETSLAGGVVPSLCAAVLSGSEWVVFG